MTTTKPPTDDVRLRRYFCDGAADLGFSAAFIGERGAAGAPRTDDKLINRGVVRLDHEKRGPGTATEHRRVHAILQRLEPRIVTVLYLAYGPESAVPGLSLPDDPQARAKLGGHLGQWRNVLIVTTAAREAFERSKAARGKNMPEWLKSGATKETIAAARQEAAALVSEAWNAWADARGRRPPRPRHVRVERESET